MWPPPKHATGASAAESGPQASPPGPASVRAAAGQAAATQAARSSPPDYDRLVPDRLYFTDSDEANALIASDPMALLVGFVLDQQITVQKAFTGPLTLRERLGAIDADTLASADLEPVFRARPAVHRYHRSMARRVHDFAVYLRDHYDGDAARVWMEARNADELRANLAAVPGIGEMKIKALGAVLAKHFGVTVANDLVPWYPTLGDVDSPQALGAYQAAKRAHRAEWYQPGTPTRPAVARRS